MRLPLPDRRGWSAATRRLPDRRRRRTLALLLPLLVALFVAAPVGPAAGDDLSDAIARQKRLEAQLKAQRAQAAELDRQQAALKTGIATTMSNLAAVNVDITAVEWQVSDLTVQITIVRGRIHGLDAQIVELDLQIATIFVQEDVKAAELQVRRELLAERIRNAYDADRTPLLEAFLSSGSFTDVLAEVGYHLDIAGEDKALAEQIVQDQETLATIHATVETIREEADLLRADSAAEKQQLDARLIELREAQATLEKLRDETKRLLAEQHTQFASLEKQEASLHDQIAATEKAEDQLRAEVQRLIELKSRQGSIPSEYNGSLRWPMVGYITQEFGCTGFSWEPPLGSCRHFHRGIDIAAPLYRPILAAGDGVVLIAGPNPYERGSNRAWVIVIAHSSRLVTWYGHVDNRRYPPAVRVGERVSAGQIVAYEGMTGRTTGPHLHWAVQFNGQFVNPRLFL